MTKETPQAKDEKTKVNRREALNLVWLATLGFFVVDLAGITYLFSMPRFKAGEFGGIYTYGTVKDLPPADSPPQNLPKVKLWLSNTDKGVLAIYKVCTHLGCLYNWNDQEVKFICPCHGSQFQLDGTFIQGPAPRSLDRFAVKAVDPTNGQVLAESTNGEPMPVPDNPDALIQVDTGNKINGAPKA